MRVAIAFAAALAFSSPALAQDIVKPLVDRLKSVDPKTATDAHCSAQVSQAARVNAMDLFYGASVCFAVKRPVEGNFLLTAGQVRAMPDMVLMEAASEAEKLKAAGLYGLMWFHVGGPGEDQVYRDPVLRARFFQMFDAWTPAYGANYNPGWAVGKRPDAAAYQALMAESKSHRRKQLAAISRAYSDDQYYALHRQFMELQKRTGATYVEGTPDAKLSAELQAKMNKRANELGIDFSGE